MTRAAPPIGEVEQLGSVSCPSGVLLILDGGLAWMWSHDRPPLLPGFPDVVGATERARDLIVRGRDASAAGLAFDRSNNPLYIYDQPGDRLDALVLAFNELVSELGLDASLETLAERVPHRRRVDLALEAGHGAGAVEFHGLWAVAFSGVPRDRLLPVMGERMPAGPDEGRWRRVWIDVGDGEVVSTREIGHVLVDEARLMAVDADALAAWDDRNSRDGKADLVFWGRDAAAVAAEVGASPIRLGGETRLFGWVDLPFGEARERAQRVGALRSDDRKFAFDFRPHTHHWQVMRDLRATRTESGVLDLAGARLCMFMTMWGDGAFPVEADLDAAGQMVRLRIEIGCDATVGRLRDMEERWFGEFAKRAIVSARVARDGAPVRFLYREAPDRADDSGWRVFAGDETDEYSNAPGNAVVLPLRDLLDRDAELKQVFRTPAPCAFERKDAKASFGRIEGYDVGDATLR
jgi:hypothetical protein